MLQTNIILLKSFSGLTVMPTSKFFCDFALSLLIWKTSLDLRPVPITKMAFSDDPIGLTCGIDTSVDALMSFASTAPVAVTFVSAVSFRAGAVSFKAGAVSFREGWRSLIQGWRSLIQGWRSLIQGWRSLIQG